MKVTIRGNNPITSDQFKSVIDDLNKEYADLGIKVKNATCYVRFVDESGKTVEPMINGQQIERIFTFRRVKEVGKTKA